MGQYFDNEDLESDIKKYDITLLGEKFTFYTDNGVFSKSFLDYGSRVLLENLPLDKLGSSVLDVGCGYGPIGIILSKVTNAQVDMIDVNHRAIHLSHMNAKENKVVDKVHIFESDTYESVEKKYDTIVTNPPIRAGKKVVYDIVMNAKDHLKENGKLFLVIRKDQGAKSLISDMEKLYHVDILERNKGFFIILGTLH